MFSALCRIREKTTGGLKQKHNTEPPLRVIYPKIGKGNAQRNLERHGLATREKRFGSRLREGKVLAPLTSVVLDGIHVLE